MLFKRLPCLLPKNLAELRLTENSYFLGLGLLVLPTVLYRASVLKLRSCDEVGGLPTDTGACEATEVLDEGLEVLTLAVLKLSGDYKGQPLKNIRFEDRFFDDHFLWAGNRSLLWGWLTGSTALGFLLLWRGFSAVASTAIAIAPGFRWTLRLESGFLD